MIRPFTLITMLLAAGSGAYLFAVKHHAQMLDDQIADISQESRLDAQRIRVLQAQWALETDPTRLAHLASQFTNLQPMQPAQLVTLAALRTSLPPAGAKPPESNPELPVQPAPAELVASSAQPAQADAAQPGVARPNAQVATLLPPPHRQVRPGAPVMTADASPAPRPFAPRPVHRVNHSVLQAANTQFAEALPPPRPYQPLPYQAPRMVAPPMMAPAAPMGAQVMSVKATQYVPAPATPPVSTNDSGSALGMAANLPPPQPLQDGMNN
jgi:hypothetical protein